MLYLGLGPDDEYEEFEEHASEVPAPATAGARGTSNQRRLMSLRRARCTMTRDDRRRGDNSSWRSQSAVNLVAA
jgi:hypothetical protein